MIERDLRIIELAATPFRYPALREEQAMVEFDLTPTRFWARVNALLDDPRMEAALPTEVRRLRRLRDARRGARRRIVDEQVPTA